MRAKKPSLSDRFARVLSLMPYRIIRSNVQSEEPCNEEYYDHDADKADIGQPHL